MPAARPVDRSSAGNRAGPPAPREFQFRAYAVDHRSGVARFSYGFDDGPDFIETIDFGAPVPRLPPAHARGFAAALEALFILCGVSYYKAFVPGRLSLSACPLEPFDAAFFRDTYLHGLSEFAYRNALDLSGRIRFTLPATAARPPATARDPADAAALPRRSAVLLGGGKDSLVSVEVLRAAGEPMLLFAVNPKTPILDCAAASGLPFARVERHLDPRLFALNDEGALNGHVPITAIVSFIATAAAFVHGFDAVVLSNERSADEANLVHGGVAVNHQYSKTSAFEAGIRGFIGRRVSSQLRYFSLLRPLSEFHIARLMARSTRYDTAFTSCNRAFKLRPEAAPTRWCRDCPKCRFTFLMLATAMEPARLRGIFGGDLLGDAGQRPGYEELTGLSGHKPWECVGELAESGAAVLDLAAHPDWADAPVIARLAPRLRALIPDPDAVRAQLLRPSAAHNLPRPFEDALRAFLG